MPKQDILFKMEIGVFSYRVAGILIHNGKVLLQHPLNDPSYAFPGGHVNFGETSQEALVREFHEEVAADIVSGRLLWIIEAFFPWGQKRCHQVGLYYQVELCDNIQIPLDGCFMMPNEIERKISSVEFTWFPLTSLEQIEVYPTCTKEKLMDLSGNIEHWVYQED
jgi:ADP-ribose pyrophosphatase YjhB (NUDIX family)